MSCWPFPNLNLTGLILVVFLFDRWGEDFTHCSEMIDLDAPLSKSTSKFLPFGSRPLAKLRSVSCKSTSSVPKYLEVMSLFGGLV